MLEERVNPLIKKPIFNSFIYPITSSTRKRTWKANKRSFVHFNNWKFRSPYSLGFNSVSLFAFSFSTYVDQQKKNEPKRNQIKHFTIHFLISIDRVHHNLLLGLLGCRKKKTKWVETGINRFLLTATAIEIKRFTERQLKGKTRHENHLWTWNVAVCALDALPEVAGSGGTSGFHWRLSEFLKKYIYTLKNF